MNTHVHIRLLCYADCNIASGKSSLLKKLSQLNGVEVRVSFVVQMFIAITPQQVLIEPVDKWRNLSGGNVIVSGQKCFFFFWLVTVPHRLRPQGRMYEVASRWGYLFQSYVLVTMMELHNKPLVRCPSAQRGAFYINVNVC